MKYNLKYYINISCVVFFKIKPTWNFIPSFMNEIVGHPWFFIGLASILYKIHQFDLSSIFSSKNIIHPWHVVKYPSMSPNISSHVSSNIPSTSTIYSWKDLFGLTCSLLTFTCSWKNILAIHKWSFKYSFKAWCLFLFRWIFWISPYIDSTKG